MKSLGLLLVLGGIPSLEGTAVTCPCLTGGQWSMVVDGVKKKLSYCANPTNARTAWCPTKDAEYDGGDFAYCEGEVALACKKLKDQADPLPACPCMPEWNYQKRKYNYCKEGCDPWCPIQPKFRAQYGRNTTYCSKRILEACEEEREKKPVKPVCPCLKGGQWKYKGKPQSYCSNPTKNDRGPWCLNDAGNEVRCHGDLDRACKELEGSRPIETELCPCLDGGSWSFFGRSISYCEHNMCPKTHAVNAANKYIDIVKCSAREKKACQQLKSLETQEGKDKMFGQYTKAGTGCPCWFDMDRTDCACCEDGALQCGAPMQNFCYKKSEGRQRGCPGVPNSQWTLSTSGFPCAGNATSRDCAWCAPGGGQCPSSGVYGPGSPHGNRCTDPHDEEYCGAAPAASCGVTHACDAEADCAFDRKFGGNLEVNSCKCRDGWRGNGIQCYNKDTGEPSPEASSGDSVSLELIVKTELFTLDATKSNSTNSTVEGSGLLSNIENVFKEGQTCSNEPGCTASYTNIVKPTKP